MITSKVAWKTAWGEFQPFLRFYIKEDGTPIVLKKTRFQPFLRFYLKCCVAGKELREQIVSTLLEILHDARRKTNA